MHLQVDVQVDAPAQCPLKQWQVEAAHVCALCMAQQLCSSRENVLPSISLEKHLPESTFSRGCGREAEQDIPFSDPDPKRAEKMMLTIILL